MLDTRWARKLPQVRSGEAILERYGRRCERHDPVNEKARFSAIARREPGLSSFPGTGITPSAWRAAGRTATGRDRLDRRTAKRRGISDHRGNAASSAASRPSRFISYSLPGGAKGLLELGRTQSFPAPMTTAYI